MIEDRAPGESAKWKEVLALGEQLINQTSIEEQWKMIVATTARLMDGEIDFCLSNEFFHLPGNGTAPEFSVSRQSSLIKAASETRHTRTSWENSSHEENQPPRVAAPLIAQGKLVGVLQVSRPVGQPILSNEIGFLETLARHLAHILLLTQQVAVNNFRFEQLTLVRSVSAQIANVLDLEELSQRVANLILDTFRYYYVGIFTVEPRQDALRFRASACAKNACLKPEMAGSDELVHLGEGIVGHAAQSGIEILAPDVTQETRYRYIDALPETKSEYAMPLKFENRVLGILDVQSDQIDAFHETDQMVLQALADNIAIAVEGVNLYNDLQRRADQMAIVAEVSRAITSILELDRLLTEVVNLLQKRFGYPYVHLFTVHPGRRKVIYQAGSGARSQAFRDRGLAYDLDAPLGIIPWVAREGKTVLANDVTKEPRYRPNELPPLETQAELAVPFVFGGEVLGVLDVQSDQTNVFHESDLSLFEALADNVAVAIRNANLYRSEKWRRQVAESLRDVAGLLSTNVALNQLLGTILTELEKNLPCDLAAIWLLEDPSKEENKKPGLYFRLAAVHGQYQSRIEPVQKFASETDPWLIRALHSQLPIIRSRDDAPDPLGAALEFDSGYSSIAAPLHAGDQPLGVLAMLHHDSGRYGSEALRMTAAFASYAAVAIDNNQLYASAQEQAWVSTVMLQIAEATQSLTTVDELLSTVVRLTPMLVGVTGCALFMWDPDHETFSLSTDYGLETDEHNAFDHHLIHPGEALAFDQVRFGKIPAFIQDKEHDLGLPQQLSAETTAAETLLIPLLARGNLLGAFLIEQHNHTQNGSNGAFSEDRLAILQGIAQQTAVAVENFRLLEGKQEEAYVTAVLLQVAQAVVSLNDLDDILTSIVQILPILVGIDFSVIYLWNSDHHVFQPAQLYSGRLKQQADALRRPFAPGEFPLLDAVNATDSLVMIPLGNPQALPDEWPKLKIPAGIINQKDYLKVEQPLLMGFPLSVKGERYGVLVTIETTLSPEARERRLEIIGGIAQQVSLAIQNDHLTREMVERERLEREFQLAREIQQTFLPSQIPAIKGWDLDLLWRTARQVGGDFYDVFELPNRRIGLVIADVSDKGMPAALYMTVTRTLIRATAPEEPTPAETLMRVNNLLLVDSQYGMFVTAVYAVLSPGTGELTYANAGHNIPLWWHNQDQSLEPLTKGGMALGVLENNQLENHTIKLLPDDHLVFYTDGLTEANAINNDFYSEQRLYETIRKAPKSSSKELLSAINRSLIEFQGDEPPSDDVTLMVLRRASPKKK